MLQRFRSYARRRGGGARVILACALGGPLSCGNSSSATTGAGTTGSDPGCYDAGTCECRNNADCPSDKSVCINAHCAVDPNLIRVLVPDADGTDVGAAGNAQGDDSGYSDGTITCVVHPEQCNGIDDDCNGIIDDPFLGSDGKYSLPANCGQCGLRCSDVFVNLAMDSGGRPAPDATTCDADADGFRCRPARCAPGFAVLRDDQGKAAVCLPESIVNCQPCTTSSDCSGGVGHTCAKVADEGTFCGQRCDANAGPTCTGIEGQEGCCPAGFVCRASGGDLACLPQGNSCRCGKDTVSLTQVCSIKSTADATTCLGTQQCTESSPGVYAFGACDTSTNLDVCDGRDNDCNGVVDDGYTVAGKYSLDTNCGACGNDCTTRWGADEHAAGVCDPNNVPAPDCKISQCTKTEVGGARLCVTDADCATDGLSHTCDPVLKACARTCSTAADCLADAGITCQGGYCTTPCADTSDCESAYGRGSTCAGTCSRPYDWKDRDGYKLNGCECAALPGDEPLVFADYPSATGAPTADRNCDGIEGNAARAIFVVASALPGGDGSRAHPLNKIQPAVDLYDPAQHDHVLVATGMYLERVTLKAGVRIYGGYSEDFTERDILLDRTTILGPEPDFAQNPDLVGTVNADAITIDTLVSGFTIQGYDVSNTAASRGKPSYAVYVRASSDKLVFANNDIIGGTGGTGTAGDAGTTGVVGGSGQFGTIATQCANQDCAATLLAGGLGGVNGQCAGADACPGMESDNADPQVASNPPAGCAYPPGGRASTYTGSGAQYCKYDCNVPSANTNGQEGTTGTNGGVGNGGAACANGLGSVAAGKWLGAAAADGAQGTAGKGGGGGSAGGWVRNNKNPAVCTVPEAGVAFGDLGGSGGGGGGGGCGGAGGKQGGAGGGTFAVFIASGSGGTFVTFRANVVVRGQGGAGGSGGAGGAGGPGGPGGRGGPHSTIAWCAGFGGSGGDGGFGGDGGGGGGGCGGPAFGFAGVGIPDYGLAAFHNQFAGTSTGGAKGLGGPAPFGNPGQDGQPGASGNVHVY